MNTVNIGIIFGPTIARNPSKSIDFNDASRDSGAFKYFVENFYNIFNKEEEQKVIELETNKKLAEDKKKLKTFTIFFPGGKKTIPHSENESKKLRPILDKICNSSNLNFTDYILQDEHGQEINPELTIKDITGLSVTLREKKKDTPAPKKRGPLRLSITPSSNLITTDDNEKNSTKPKSNTKPSKTTAPVPSPKAAAPITKK